MTVGAQVKQTIASLKGVHATLESFAAMEGNQESKDALWRSTRRINGVIKVLEKRAGVLEFEEPQYKGF